MKHSISKMTLISIISLMISGTTINSYVSADSNKSINSQIKKFKQQTTDDATIATKKSISKLGNNSLNYFIPTQARKIKGNSIQDPGSDANFVTKVNYSARNNPQNRINLPKGYSIALLKKAAQKNSWKNTKLQIKIGRIGLQGLAMNSFTPSKRDLSRIVNLNHVTQAQNVELNNFTLSLINPIIKKLGGIQYLSSYNAVKAAQNVADVYSQDNWNNTGSKVGHDSRFRRVVGSKFNIKDVAEENYTDNPSLGLTEIKLKNRDVSMAALKHAIYNSVALQLFEDGPSYWGHATALMNLDIHKKYQPNYFGTSFDKFGGLHFFMIPHNKKVNVDFKPF